MKGISTFLAPIALNMVACTSDYKEPPVTYRNEVKVADVSSRVTAKVVDAGVIKSTEKEEVMVVKKTAPEKLLGLTADVSEAAKACVETIKNGKKKEADQEKCAGTDSQIKSKVYVRKSTDNEGRQITEECYTGFLNNPKATPKNDVVPFYRRAFSYIRRVNGAVSVSTGARVAGQIFPLGDVQVFWEAENAGGDRFQIASTNGHDCDGKPYEDSQASGDIGDEQINTCSGSKGELPANEKFLRAVKDSTNKVTAASSQK